MQDLLGTMKIRLLIQF